MRSFPRFAPPDAGDRLPLTDATAGLLLEALLTTDVEQRTAIVSRAMRYDPALVLWSLYHFWQPQSMKTPTVGRLAAQLDHRLLELLAEGQAAGEIAEEKSNTSIRTAAVQQVVDSVRIADRAAEFARDRDAAVAEEAYLLGLLHNSPAWRSIFNLEADKETGESPRPRSVDELLDRSGPYRQLLEGHASPLAAECVMAALQEPDDGGLAREAVATARRHWQTTTSLAAQLLPLAERLVQWGRLESNFTSLLEEEKLRAMYKLAAGAGHEINNPLGSIAGRAQLLLRDETDPERRRTLAKINSQAFRAHEMIADMMLFARPPVPRCGLVDTAGLIDDLIAEMKEMSEQREAEIVSHVREDVSFLRVDASQLMVALRAMCTNSLEAMGHGGRIEISARLSPGRDTDQLPGGDTDQHDESKDVLRSTVEISVSDNGPGFSAEQRRHLFDPFYSGREAGRGLGFGLSKCWRIVRNHGGVIDVESTPGQGATFRINLPAV